MFCGNCGAENVNNENFCHSCGKPLNEVNGGNEPKVEVEQGNAGSSENGAGAAKLKAEVNELAKKAKALPKMAIIGGCAALVALIVIICVVMNAKATINLNDYLTIKATGYDGYGSVKATIDWDAIEEKYGKKVSFTSKAKKEYGSFIKLTTPVEIIEESVRVKLDTMYDLSNGDKISYTWKIDEDLSEYVKCKIVYKDDKYSVSGLKKIDTFDAFADLEVTFSGISPNGSVRLNYTGANLSTYDFNCDVEDGLSNGDIVKISIFADTQYFINNFGKVPETLEKEYKVEGLNSYVSNTASINEKALETMQKQAEDVFHSDVARNWEDCVSLESFTYVGNYLLTLKDTNSWASQNHFYLVYKVQSKEEYANEEESYSGTTDYYWFIQYTDLVTDGNGELLVDVTDYDTPRDNFTVDSGISAGWWSTKYWSYVGYQSLDDLYKAAVTSYIHDYNHEDNIVE